MPQSVNERIAVGRVALGSRLREVRESASIGLADASQRAGISYSYLSDVERGRRLPTLEVLDALAVALDTTIVRLLSGLYPWDSSIPVKGLQPPPDGRRRRTNS